jgi:chromosome partitioning protein
MAKVIATIIRKGGSGKTTTAISLASGLAKQGKRVLLVDLDSQASASEALRISDSERNIASVLSGRLSITDAIQPVKDFYLLASSGELADYEPTLIASFNLHAVKSLLDQVRPSFDYIVIDTPPSDGILTRNALVASDLVIIPTQAHYLAIKGLHKALELVSDIKQINQSLELIGILPTMLQSGTNVGEVFMEQLRTDYGDKVLPYAVPLTIKVTESHFVGQPLLDYAPEHRASEAYIDVAKHIINKHGA